ncbi:MAG: carbamoyltransferase C-terminal domain-containing protein [Bryobacteraceae bacterium]
MIILGIGGILNDAAAALIRNGELRTAVEQRKIARYTRPGELPMEAITACLREARAGRDQVDCVVLVRPAGDPEETSLHLRLRALFPNARVVMMDHHTAHAASAFFASPFEDATVLTIDRKGDLRCGARWKARGTRLELERELYFPDSVADLYSRVTEFLGYTPNADEHKLQWMSAAGDDRYRESFGKILQRGPEGWPRVDWSYFDSHRIARGGFGPKFYRELGLDDEAEFPAPRRAHLAAGLQRAVEAVIVGMAGSGENLALAGGMGFNALVVSALERSGDWKNVFVQPASGNSGTALGAAMWGWHIVCGQHERVSIGNLCLGPSYAAEEIKQVLENCKLRFRLLLTTGELIQKAVAELDDYKIIAWMQGSMEFGPRALGNRSILASPRNPYSTENLNKFIKHRDDYRKFAASVPAERAAEYFEPAQNSRFLATVSRVRPEHRKTFEPAVLGDGWVRLHTVHREDNPLYHSLLLAAGEATGLPVLYNTSFNLFGDPLVCTPRDAVRSFYSSGIDAMFVGNFHLEK